MTKVVIYARVSTQNQDYQRQLLELRNYANSQNYTIVKEFAETISGAITIAEREALSDLLSYVKKNKINKILIYECSRLSRKAIDFLTIIETLNNLKVSVFILQNGLETLLPNGQVNPTTNLVLGILAQFNSMERSLIRSRMESGYNIYRANGGVVGRPNGYRKPQEKYYEQYNEEIKLLKKGISIINISRITGTSTKTINKVRKLLINKELNTHTS